MEKKVKKPISYYVRMLHRDAGFFIFGLILVYALSGIVLVYRDTNFMKFDKVTERSLPPNVDQAELGRMLFIRDFEVLKVENDIVYFRAGTYNKTTGIAIYTTKELPVFMQKMTNLHKIASNSFIHWYTVLFGVVLLFQAISSFWLVKKGTNNFRRGVYITIAGAIITIIVMFL
jgi:hypothetical protein